MAGCQGPHLPGHRRQLGSAWQHVAYCCSLQPDGPAASCCIQQVHALIYLHSKCIYGVHSSAALCSHVCSALRNAAVLVGVCKHSSAATAAAGLLLKSLIVMIEGVCCRKQPMLLPLYLLHNAAESPCRVTHSFQLHC